MLLSSASFGLRKEPKWDKGDLKSHFQLAKELNLALVFAHGYVSPVDDFEFIDTTWDSTLFDSLTHEEKTFYFLNYAVRLQSAYLLVMRVLSDYCGVKVVKTPGYGYCVTLDIEQDTYYCNYLYDHICVLTWVIRKLNHHVGNY